MTKNDGIKLHFSTLLPLVYTSQEDFDQRYAVGSQPFTTSHKAIHCII